jgi:hypothetical protein
MEKTRSELSLICSSAKDDVIMCMHVAYVRVELHLSLCVCTSFPFLHVEMWPSLDITYLLKLNSNGSKVVHFHAGCPSTIVRYIAEVPNA